MRAEQRAEPGLVGRQVGADERPRVVEPDAARDRARRARVVAGEHEDADAGGTAALDRRGHLGSHGVLDADEAEQLERALGVLRDCGHAVARGLGQREHAQAAVRERVRGGERGATADVVDRARLEHRLRRALHEHPVAWAVRREMHRRHAPSRRRERERRHAGQIARRVVPVDAALAGEREERTFPWGRRGSARPLRRSR